MFDFDARFRCIDDSDAGTALRKWSDMMVSGAEKQEAGFVDVVEERLQWPLNTWPKGKYYKTLGLWYNQDLHEAFEGLTMAVFTRVYGMKKEEVQEIVSEVLGDIDDKNIHSYLAL
jgi:hypothetical protein